MQPFARTVQVRIDALAAAHRYVSPQDFARASSVGSETVKGLLRLLTAPYKGERETTLVIEGENAPIGLKAAGALALIVQELATNAVKYGAFSEAAGTITLSCGTADGRYALLWREDGGPRLSGAPSRLGFGSMFCDALAASAQIDVKTAWRPEGLLASISMPLEGLDV